MARLSRSSVVAIWVLLGLTRMAGAQEYTLSFFGGDGSHNSSCWPVAINATGQVAGYAFFNGQTQYQAFTYQNSTFSDIGTFGLESSYAYGNNSLGQVVCWASSGLVSRPFLYSNGTITDLSTVAPTMAVAYGINNLGQIVGQNSSYHACSYSNGVTTDLGTLEAGGSSYAQAVNDAGQIIGQSNAPTGGYVSRAFIISNGTMTDLGTFGGTTTHALSINSSGEVAGYSNLPGDATQHPFVYSDGTLHDLGTLGGIAAWGTGINDQGDVVGESDDKNNQLRAFLYRDGVMQDLNLLAPPHLGIQLSAAMAINDSGQITGWALTTDSVQAMYGFLLTPVPEPASITVLVGAGMLIVRRRRV